MSTNKRRSDLETPLCSCCNQELMYLLSEKNASIVSKSGCSFSLLCKDDHMSIIGLHLLRCLHFWACWIFCLLQDENIVKQKTPNINFEWAVHTSNLHLFSMPFYITKSVQIKYSSQLVCLPIPSNHSSYSNYCDVFYSTKYCARLRVLYTID